MTRSIESESDLAHLETVLDAGCAALVVLQTLPGPAVPGPADVRAAVRQIRHMTNVLRATIDNLQAAREQEPSMLAFGFVLAAEAAGGAPPQVSPRRTA